MNKKILIILFLVFFANVSAASDCSRCEGCWTPRRLEVTLDGIISFNGLCDTRSCGECTIRSMSVNGIYTLEQDISNSCKWCYEDNDSNLISTRSGSAPERALGLKICATKGHYPQFPDKTYVLVSSLDGNAWYFRTIKKPENCCVSDSNIPNDLQNCCCSPWMDIPPWTAGLNGTASIRAIFDFEDFANFADSWLKDDLDYMDLALFLEDWL